MATLDDEMGPVFLNTFDFTTLFEQSIFMILPAAAFLLLALFRLFFLLGLPTSVLSKKLLVGKLITLFGIWLAPFTNRNRASIAQAVVSVVASIAILALVYLEHRRSFKPSTLVGGYLLLTIILDLPLLRTLLTRSGNTPLAAVSTLSLAAKVLLLALEECPKQPIDDSIPVAPETKAGVLSQLVGWWQVRLFIVGNKKILNFDDLDPLLDKLRSLDLLEKVRPAWLKSSKRGKNSLLYSSSWALRLQFAKCIIPRLCQSGFTLAQPFLIHAVVEYVDKEQHNSDENVAGGLVGATALVYLGYTTSYGLSLRTSLQLSAMVRGSLVALIYSETLEMDSAAVKDSAPVTLMSTDVDLVVQGYKTINDAWPAALELGLALWLLYTKVGVAGFFVLIPAVVGLGVATAIAPLMVKYRIRWTEHVQKRIGDTSTMLSQMKGIKMMGLSSFFDGQISQKRRVELKSSMGFRKMGACWVMCSYLIETFPSVAVMLATILWIKRAQGVSTAEAFTILSLTTITYAPLEFILVAMNSGFPGVAAMRRIQEFLVSEKRVDSRQIMDGKLSATTSKELAMKEKQDSIVENVTEVEKEGGINASSNQQPDDGLSASISNATFVVNGTKEILHDISIDFIADSLNMVVGRVGSGKSSLLRGLVGEMAVKSGQVKVATKSTAYCAQKAWVQNVSIKENIIGQSKYNPEWFRDVLRACALQEDVNLFPDGEETLVGTGGVSLSGGQRQRVAVARAAYSKANIVVLDDVFGGLDNKTARAVFRGLLGPTGILRRGGVTVILATHNTHFLRAADYITMLDEGRIVHNQVAYSSLKPEDWGVIEELEPGNNSEAVIVADEEEELDLSEAKGQRRDLLAAKEAEQIEDNLKRQEGDWDCYKIIFRAMGYKHLAVGLTFNLLHTFFLKMTQIWIQFWTKAGTSPDDKGYVAGYVIMAAFGVIFGGLNYSYFALLVLPGSSYRLHDTLLKTVIRAPLSFFAKTDRGVTLNRFSQDIGLIDGPLPFMFVFFITAVGRGVIEIAVVAAGASYGAILIPFILAILYYVQKFYLRTSRQIRLLDLELKSFLYTQFSETLDGISTIRAFGWSDTSNRENLRLLDRSQRPLYTMDTIQRCLQVMLSFWVAITAIVLVSFAVFVPSSTSKGAIGLAMVNLIGMNETLTFVMDYWVRLETSLGAIARLKWFQNSTPCEDRPEEKGSPGSDWPQRGEVELDNVTASYSEDTAPVLHNVSIKIKAGQKVGICGRSGSGKTSIILTLLRLLDIEPDGRMTIDSESLTQMPRQTIRSRMTALPQDSVIFNGTVRQNLDPEGVIQADEPLIDALKKTSMWSVMENHGGLEAIVDDLGLSAGQMQLFCLSRVILRRGGNSGRVVLLDEATSSVDKRTDDEVREAIRDDLDGRTIIEVAHRLEIIKDYDVIVVMGAGNVLEVGTPDELLAKSDSEFKSLWDSRGL